MCTIEYHPNNYIIEDLGHSWGTSLKKMFEEYFLEKNVLKTHGSLMGYFLEILRFEVFEANMCLFFE